MLAEALADAPPAPFVAAAVEGRDERRDAVRTLRVSAQAPDGSALPDARVRLRPPLRDVGPLSMGGRTHRDFDLPTQGLRPNLPGGVLRFVVEIAWGGGGDGERRELPLAMHL